MGFIALAISLASFPALVSGSSGLKTPRKARKLVDMAAFRDRLFVVFTCASFICFLGYIIPSWGVTIVCFVHTCHRDCSIILRATLQRICGTLCWQHAYVDGMCAHL